MRHYKPLLSDTVQFIFNIPGKHIVLDEESKARLEKARLDRAQFFEEEKRAAIKEPTPPKTPTPSPPRTPTPPPKSPTPPPKSPTPPLPPKSPTPPLPKSPPVSSSEAAASLAAAKAVIEEGETRLKQTYEQQISSLEQNVDKHKKSFDQLMASRFSEVCSY